MLVGQGEQTGASRPVHNTGGINSYKRPEFDAVVLLTVRHLSFFSTLYANFKQKN